MTTSGVTGPLLVVGGVEDLLVVDPLSATVQWYGRGSEGFEPVDRSTTLGLSATEVHSTIDWPPPD